MPVPGPRIYNLFPLLAGPIEDPAGRDWSSHIERIAAMGFDWLFVNPFHLPGFSGSLYAIKDPYALHPIVQGSSRKRPDKLLSGFIRALAKRDMRFMVDLVINHTSKDALLASEHPEWYMREPDGEFYSPRAIDPADANNVTVWGDLAQLNYDDPAACTGLIGYWKEYIQHYLRLGVRGFRCDAAYQVPADVWARLIGAARAECAEVVFFAETLGSTFDQVRALEQAGFDYFFNSAKWWDFQAPWLLEQYESFRQIAPSIAFPESHDTERLVTTLGDCEVGLVERHYKQRYLFSTLFATGVMVPMGYEYGFAKELHVVETTPADWETPRFDLSGFIAAANAAKSACPALNVEGPQRALKGLPSNVLALLRLTDESGKDGCALTLLNPSPKESVTIHLDSVLSQIGVTFDQFADITPATDPWDLAAASSFAMGPLETRLLRGDHLSGFLAAKAPATAEVSAELTPEAITSAPPAEVVRAIVAGDHGDLFTQLGMHADGAGGALTVRAFYPGAQTVEVIDAESSKVVDSLYKIHPAGFFSGLIGRRKKPFPYRLRITGDGWTSVVEDPYRFSAVLGELDVHLLSEGKHLHAFEKLGAHLRVMEGVSGVAFAVWAPNARRVAVVGPFNSWDGRRHVMRLRHECGIWEIFVPGIGLGETYKFEIKGPGGELMALKSDPYGNAMEKPPRTASIVQDIEHFEWQDSAWMAARKSKIDREAPVSIYEVHLGSWQRIHDEGNRYLTYAELAEQLVGYVVDMGFTHIQLMPVSEFPFDGSWGYQPIGLFAPTSRFGTPADFKFFIERCHQAGLGVLIDWVPGHFPTDPHGLGYFDGTHLYEHADPRQGFHQDWSTLIYNYGRNEVCNFLLSNALFWLDRYHIDGLRVDAVASMLYLDYSRNEGEWIPNRYGGNENLEAIDFLRRMNELAYGEHPGTVTVAEESTAFPGVSQPTYLGGLGFGYKWNMGWMHDTLEYMGREPIHRRYHHHEMTFGLLYAFSENFVLPLSHDEVVHGKGSLLGRMPGDTWQQFANLRAYFGFMWTHPGKKLLFMGGEFAQGREWNNDQSLDWHLLDIHWHRGVQQLVRDLNNLYRSTPALYQLDCDGQGFQWIKSNDADESIYAYLRRGKEGASPVVVVCNFAPVVRQGVRLGVPAEGHYGERLNTDAAVYGGGDVGNLGGVDAEALPWDGLPCSIAVTAPPLATLIFELEKAPKRAPAKASNRDPSNKKP